MTGRADGTTLLDGEVSVNCGNRLSMCEPPPAENRVTGAENGGPTTICRISVDGKASVQEESEEVYFLRCELAQASARIEQLENSRAKLQEKLTSQSQRLLSLGIGTGHRFEGSNLDESNRLNGLIRRYEHLYSQVRVNVLDALDQMDELKDSTELKTKLLFSVMVLAYRSTEQTLREISCSARSLLRIDTRKSPVDDQREEQREEELASAKQDLEAAIGHYLRTTCAYFDIHKNVEEVCSQIWDTLFDYPCLQKCPALVDFVQQCAQLSWSLHVQPTQFSMEIEHRLFREDWHSRVHTADSSSSAIKCYLWPALFQEGICVHKGSVLT